MSKRIRPPVRKSQRWKRLKNQFLNVVGNPFNMVVFFSLLILFCLIIIPLLIPLALRGVTYKPIGASALLRRNLFIYGLGGIVAPFVGIKLIDILISVFF